MHEYLALLSGEDTDLAYAELEAVYSPRITFRMDRVVVFKSNVNKEDIIGRLAGTKLICDFTEYVNNKTNALEAAGYNIFKKIQSLESFKIKIHVLNKGRNVETEVKEYTKALAKYIDLDVNVKDPDVLIYGIVNGSKVFLGLNPIFARKRRFEARKVSNRAISLPISMNPKLARQIVNLTGAKIGERILDPFCGSGGLLLEAADIGLKTSGRDIDLDMVWACKRNLEKYGYDIKDIHRGDAIKDILRSDYIVTDLPYAKASKTFGKTLEQLYSEFITNLARKGEFKRAVIVAAKNLEKEFLERGFKIKGIYTHRVHGRLTRYIHVVE